MDLDPTAVDGAFSARHTLDQLRRHLRPILQAQHLFDLDAVHGYGLAGTPNASQPAASAISAKPVAGMTTWPCTLWSASQGISRVPTSACHT